LSQRKHLTRPSPFLPPSASVNLLPKIR
jgi:hypothetical protein